MGRGGVIAVRLRVADDVISDGASGPSGVVAGASGGDADTG